MLEMDNGRTNSMCSTARKIIFLILFIKRKIPKKKDNHELIQETKLYSYNNKRVEWKVFVTLSKALL